jgi:ADP-ribosylglycohydrolase
VENLTGHNNSKGCGALMRAAPFGLAAKSRAEAFTDGRDAGVLTHGHPSGYLAAAVLASLTYDLAHGESLDAALGETERLLAREKGHNEVSAALAHARSLAKSGRRENGEELGPGALAEEALAVAVYALLTGPKDEPERILWRTALRAGHQGAAASVTGALLGAMNGIQSFPANWVEELETGVLLDRVAHDFYASVVLGSTLDFESYPPTEGELRAALH